MSRAPILAALLAASALLISCAADRAAAPDQRADSSSIPSAPPPPNSSKADLALWRLLDEALELDARADPLSASRRGDRRFDALLPDLSEQARNADLAARRDLLARLRAIDRAALSPERRVDAALLQSQLEAALDGARFNLWQTPVLQVGGPQQDLPQLPDQLSFTSRKHLEDFASRLDAVPAYLDQTIADMRAGIAARRVPPKIVMARVHEQALAQGAAPLSGDPSRHALFRPFASLPAGDPLRNRALASIASRVAPAFDRLGAFLRDEYLPRCADSISAADQPEGPALYAFLLRRMTTTSLTADQIHSIGLSEVARIRAEMLATIARTDFPQKNSLRGDDLFKAFLAHLRGNPRFAAKDPEDLLARYRAFAKRVDAELPRLFGTLPRLTYGVRPMPDFMAPTSPTAYYNPGSLETGVAGYFLANTYNLPERPTYEIMPLTLHEAVPGHHLQGSIAREATGIHPWRREQWFTAYGEGWALYAERLGLEMSPRPGAAITDRGIFDDPYDDFGRLTYEMWRAMRLVVDTGIHSKGWSRDQAINYMLSNSGLSRENVEREVDRYIAWPGQATAYKIGELRIRALRAETEQTLGAQFNIRDFHDAVLRNGSIPLDVLDASIREWASELLSHRERMSSRSDDR